MQKSIGFLTTSCGKRKPARNRDKCCIQAWHFVTLELDSTGLFGARILVDTIDGSEIRRSPPERC